MSISVTEIFGGKTFKEFPGFMPDLEILSVNTLVLHRHPLKMLKIYCKHLISKEISLNLEHFSIIITRKLIIMVYHHRDACDNMHL